MKTETYNGDQLGEMLLRQKAHCLECGRLIVFESGVNFAKSKGIDELVVGILSLVFTAKPVNDNEFERNSSGGSDVIIILALVAFLAFGIISVVKAKRHNANIQVKYSSEQK
jgi:hypothetical protein